MEGKEEGEEKEERRKEGKGEGEGGGRKGRGRLRHGFWGYMDAPVDVIQQITATYIRKQPLSVGIAT